MNTNKYDLDEMERRGQLKDYYNYSSKLKRSSLILAVVMGLIGLLVYFIFQRNSSVMAPYIKG